MLWELPLARSGLGGLAATATHVLFGDRDVDDFHDVFRCLDAMTGEPIWQVERLAIGALDYGNSPRATPLMDGDRVYCLGAHGNLLCLKLTDGSVIWERNIREQFHPDGDLPWGYCGSPLLINGKLIVNPGAVNASLVAYDAATGEVAWTNTGAPASYGSLTHAFLGGVEQIVGHDRTSLGGWDPATGVRLWEIVPQSPGDFNVPTPVLHNDRLLITTENNGARLFQFRDEGKIVPAPIATNSKLRPDMSTGVVVGDRFYCVNQFLYCLDLKNDLNELWRIRDSALSDYAAIVASADYAMIIGRGELLLLKTDGSSKIISRQRVFDDGLPVYSHPAFAGPRIYIRGETKLVCLAL